MPRDPRNHIHAPVVVKLEKPDIAALDHFVKVAGLNGRSHALRVLVGPYMSAMRVAMESKSTFKAAKELMKEMHAVNQLFEKAAKTEAESGQQTFASQLEVQPT